MLLMKEFGKMMKFKRGSKKIKMEFIMAHLSNEKDLVEGNFIGKVDNITMGNGKMGKNMGVDIGNQRKKILM